MSLSRRELDDLKPKISGIVEKVLGFSDSALVSAAIQCLRKDLDKSKTIEQLQPLMDKSSKKFVEAMYKVVDDVKSKKKSRKRKDDDGDNVSSKKVRRFVEPEATATPVVALPAEPVSESPGMLTTQQIKNMMDHARKQIEQRKEQLKMMDPNDIRAQADAAKAANGREQEAFIESTMSKAEKATELQKKIQEKLAARPGLLGAGATAISGPEAMASMIAKLTGKESEESAPKPLILDEQGRTVDASGQLLNIPHRVPTLKANIRAQKREEFRQKLTEKPQESTVVVNKYFDPRVSQDEIKRQRRQFKFHEEGRFVQIAQKIRTKSQLEKLQNEIAQAARKTGIQQASKLALIAPKAVAESGQVPDLEWWDEFLMPTTDASMSDEKYHGITNLIEHPTQLDAPGKKKEVVLGLYLTKKERKKLRRLNRRETQKDEQEKIRLGLVPAPEPKVKLSNLMRVLGNDAIQDPTKVEQHVRAQMAKRRREHEQANAARKLTTEQRKDKKAKKLRENVSSGVEVSIYRIRSMRDPAKRFKIEANSKQLYMTGCTVMYKDINVVVVEGGPKAQRKFNRLMTIRLKWEEEKKSKKDEDDLPNTCQLIWEGKTKQKNFGSMTFKQCLTEAAAREFFKKHGVEHYWDLAHSQKVLED